MSKRLRVEDDFNPVYPYGYARNQNMPFLTPPFVSSDGFKNFPPGVLSLKLADPIAITNGDVSLKVGGGLTVEQQTGNLSVNPDAPLQVASDKLQLALAPPFEVRDGKLALKAGNGLKVLDKSITGLTGLLDTLVVLTGRGIGTEELKNDDGVTIKGVGLRVRLGDDGGLTFDKKGDLVAWNKKDDRRTLWTTPDTSPNCKMSTEKDSKLTLTLTKCGSQVLANVSLLAVTGEYHNMTATTKKDVKISLLFDENGILLPSSSLSEDYWNYRSDDSIVSQKYDNAVPFMPNLTAYPKPSAQNAKNYSRTKIISNVYLGALTYQPVIITIAFNQETDNGCAYSITFTFTWQKDYSNQQFDVTSFTFSYLTQENKDKDK